MKTNKSRRRGWVGHIARMEEKNYAYNILVRNLKDLENRFINGRIILKWSFTLDQVETSGWLF
jgi:hypothetical protein